MFGTWGTTIGYAQSEQQVRLNASYDFLETGNLATSLGGTSCNNSNQCASGWYCNSKGKCQQATTSVDACSGGTSTSGGGNCTDGGCLSTGCSNDETSDCCGARYCRYSSDGNNGIIVYCACGNPPQGKCNTFCNSYYHNTGQLNGGCRSDQVCTECEYCDNDQFCQSTNAIVPCHCGKYSLPDCYKCNADGTTVFDDRSCSYCCPQSLDCGCGKTVSTRGCYSLAQLRVYGGAYISACQKAREELEAACAKACPPSKSICDGKDCKTITKTFSGACNCSSEWNFNENRIEVSCGSGSPCASDEIGRISGTIQVGSTCTQLIECCKKTDETKNQACRSDADCPAGKKCGTQSGSNCSGCYPDPAKACNLPAIGPCQRWQYVKSCTFGYVYCFITCYCTLYCYPPVATIGDPEYNTCWNGSSWYSPTRAWVLLTDAYCPTGNCFEVVLGETSDYRMKNMLISTDNAIDQIKKMKPIKFIDKDLISVEGFLPEDLDDIAPYAIIGEKATTNTGVEAYRYVLESRLVSLLVSGIQKIYDKIDELEDEINHWHINQE